MPQTAEPPIAKSKSSADLFRLLEPRHDVPRTGSIADLAAAPKVQTERRGRSMSSSFWKKLKETTSVSSFGGSGSEADLAGSSSRTPSTTSLQSFQKSPRPKRSDSFHNLASLAAQKKNFHYELSDFDIIKQIGSGAYGRIQLCKHRQTGAVVVLKTLKMQELLRNQHTMTNVKEEFTTLMELVTHEIPFTVRTLGAFHDDTRLHFVMEYIGGGELFCHLMASRKGHFSNERACFYAAEVAVALKYMHQQAHVVYRDIKTENVMIDDDGHVKIIDFGLVKHLAQGQTTNTIIGTPDYMSPEMVSGEPYSFEVDFWAYGVLIFEMLMGVPPFQTRRVDGKITYRNIQEVRFCVPFNKDCTPEAKDIILRLLQRDRTKRLGHTKGWEAVMGHPWFANINWEALAQRKVKPPSKHRFQKGMIDVQGSVARERLGAKPSVLGRIPSAQQQLFDGFDSVVRLSVDKDHEEHVSVNYLHEPQDRPQPQPQPQPQATAPASATPPPIVTILSSEPSSEDPPLPDIKEA